jgi:O-antigen ligase
MSTPAAPIAQRLGEPPLLLAAAAALAATTVGVLAAQEPSLTLAGAAAIVVAVVTLRSFTAGVALFTTLTFFEGAPGFGGTLSVVKLLTLVLFAAWAVVIARGRSQPMLVRDRPVVFAVMLLLFVWAAASALWATDSATTESGAFRLVQMLVLVILVFSAIRDRRDLQVFARAYIAGAVLTALVALAGIGSGTQGGGGARFGGYLGNPNNLAAAVLPALALSGFMLLGSRRTLERVVLATCGIVLLVTLVLTQSRGGLVGLAAMVVTAVVIAGPARQRIVQLLVLIAVGGLVYYEVIATSAVRHRATSFSASESTGRVDLWHVSLRMFEAHPIQGVGLDNFTVLAPGYLARDLAIQRADLFLRSVATQVHNTYLTILAELGLAGELLFLGLLIGIFVVAHRAIGVLSTSADRQGELLGRGLFIGAIGMVTAYFFFSAQYEKQLWLVLGGLLSLATVARASFAQMRTTRTSGSSRRRAP